MTDDIAAFVTACLDEEAAAAEAASEGYDGKWRPSDPGSYTECRIDSEMHGHFVIYDEGGHNRKQAEHIVRHDPAHVLRRIAAMRRIVELHTTGRDPYVEHRYCEVCGPDCVEVPLLAALYSDRPGYNPAWNAG